MQIFLFLSELGLSAFDNNTELIRSVKFDDPIRAFNLIRAGGHPEEIARFIKNLRSEKVFVNDININSILKEQGLDTEMMSAEQQNEFQSNKPAYLVKATLADDEHKALLQLREFAIQLSSSKVKETSERLDLHVIQSINALDELDKQVNTMGERLREWYGLHFPELDNLVQSLAAYAQIVNDSGLRQEITGEILERAGLQDKKMSIILDAARRSKGGDMTLDNLAIVKKLASEIITLTELRKKLADHVESSMELIAPNIKELLTASVGARMISKAGSLARFATLPASTIQILGAEKALFRSLKTGAMPPKHGLLFQHPLIHSAPRWQRGKIARTVASKVSIAARIDLYRREKDPAIAVKMTSRIEQIQLKYKNPPQDEERTFAMGDARIMRSPFGEQRREGRQGYRDFSRSFGGGRRDDKKTRDRGRRRKRKEKNRRSPGRKRDY
jgi:nucleolar protein 56